MIDLQLTNAKLVERAKGIVMNLADVDYDQATLLLNEAKGNVKHALVMAFTNSNYEQAQALLQAADGFVKRAVEGSKNILINDEL